jgi:sarcosine oxidase
MIERRDVVVVGAGLLGLAAARALASCGRDATVLDQAQIGHEGAGSKGSCRIFRLGYDDARYVALARRSRELWTELEDAAGERLLHPTPQLTFGAQMPTVRDALRQAGATCQLLSAEQAAERFPGLTAPGPVLLESDSCVIAADRALSALADAAPEIRLGVRVTGLADDGRRVLVSTDAGPIDAGRVIVCAGPWTAGILATAGIAAPAGATQEQVCYLVPAGPGPAPEMPIFVDYSGASPYGLPVPGSPRYKIGIHHGGPAIDPDRQIQELDTALGHRIEQLARQFLPAHDPRPVAVERCVYDNSPDTDFIVDRIGNVVIGSGTSGHGFKFGPLLGEWLAALAAGDGARAGAPASPGLPDDSELPPSWFALSRFRATAPGPATRSLTTRDAAADAES